ncbi:hypothetical protein GCM10009780_78290 [Actinomadura alba]
MRCGQLYPREGPLSRNRTAVSALALAALALSAGFTADRLLLTEPETQLVFQERPTGTTAPTAADGEAPAAPAAPPTSFQTTEPTPPLKRIHRPPEPARRSSAPSASPTRRTVVSAGGGVEETVAQLTNRERAKAGCGPLKVDARLRTAARRHSADMAARDYFSHDAPDGSTFVDRIKAAGYLSPGAENIAKGYSTPAAVMAGWMKSPGHRANILNCDLRAIGVGAHFAPGGPWWTQDFGWE